MLFTVILITTQINLLKSAKKELTIYTVVPTCPPSQVKNEFFGGY